MGDKRWLIIDEAQTVPEIGKILKLMVDEIDGIKIVATGSSVFDLENDLNTYPLLLDNFFSPSGPSSFFFIVK